MREIKKTASEFLPGLVVGLLIGSALTILIFSLIIERCK